MTRFGNAAASQSTQAEAAPSAVTPSLMLTLSPMFLRTIGRCVRLGLGCTARFSVKNNSQAAMQVT